MTIFLMLDTNFRQICYTFVNILTWEFINYNFRKLGKLQRDLPREVWS